MAIRVQDVWSCDVEGCGATAVVPYGVGETVRIPKGWGYVELHDTKRAALCPAHKAEVAELLKRVRFEPDLEDAPLVAVRNEYGPEVWCAAVTCHRHFDPAASRTEAGGKPQGWKSERSPRGELWFYCPEHEPPPRVEEHVCAVMGCRASFVEGDSMALGWASLLLQEEPMVRAFYCPAHADRAAP